jgi:hypothetical protein
MLFSARNSLKEDAPVDNGIDIAVTLQPAQAALIVILSGILIVWMLVFAWLAIRPNPESRVEASGKSAPALAPVLAQTPVPVARHTLTPVPVTTLAQDVNGKVALESSTR